MKRTLSFLLSLVMMLGIISNANVTVNAASNGVCGDDVIWAFDEGALTISGTGEMYDYTSHSSLPWYDVRSSIITITVGDGVKSIGDYAFSYCDNVISVTIGNQVTRVGDYAFYNCASISAIKFPDGVISIGDYAFCGCSNLNSVIIPDSVTGIGSYAFYGCPGIEFITIPNSVVTIGNSAFGNCVSLELIEIPDSVTTIGDSAFEHCASLASVTIGNGVTGIGESAFEYCTKLSSLIFGDSVTEIGVRAFYNCTKLKTIEIPDSVRKIGDSAFSFCTGITSITIPDSVTNIAGYAFYGCDSLTSIVIPDSITSLGNYVFYSCDNLSSITIPDSIKSIGESAFYMCKNLRYVFYTGTKDEWQAITIGSDNSELTNAKIHYEATEHKSSDWITDKKATVNAPGSKYKECTVCGAELKTAKIAQLKCSTPKLKSAINTATGVKFTWNKVTGADYYRVYRKTGKYSWKRIATVKGTVTAYTDKTAKSGTIYKYTVRAQNEAGLSGYITNGISIKCIADPVLKTPASTRSGITLKWSKVTGAQGYIVYRKVGNGNYKRLATVKGISRVSYTDKSARKGIKYSYRVRAYSGKTYSVCSNTKTIKDKY